jgi:hypothetical protein
MPDPNAVAGTSIDRIAAAVSMAFIFRLLPVDRDGDEDEAGRLPAA